MVESGGRQEPEVPASATERLGGLGVDKGVVGGALAGTARHGSAMFIMWR